MELSKYQRQAADIENQDRQAKKDKLETKAAKYSIKGYWWMIVLTIIGLIFSIIELYK